MADSQELKKAVKKMNDCNVDAYVEAFDEQGSYVGDRVLGDFIACIRAMRDVVNILIAEKEKPKGTVDTV